MKGQHSPGPWSWDGENNDIDAAGGGCVCWIQPHGNVNTVSFYNEEFSHADARLIAKAPEMLAMLRRIRSTCHLFEENTLADDIDRLIAEATGPEDPKK